MGIKEFLKPSISKIISVIIFCFIAFFSYFSVFRSRYFRKPFSIGGGIILIIHYILTFPYQIFIKYIDEIRNFSSIGLDVLSVIAVIINIIYLFILTCIIIYFIKSYSSVKEFFYLNKFKTMIIVTIVVLTEIMFFLWVSSMEFIDLEASIKNSTFSLLIIAYLVSCIIFMVCKKLEFHPVIKYSTMLILIIISVFLLTFSFVKADVSEESRTTRQEQIAYQIREDLTENDKKLSFTTERIPMERGDRKEFVIGVRNTKKDNKLNFMIDIYTEQAKYPGETENYRCIKSFNINEKPNCDPEDIKAVEYFYVEDLQKVDIDESSLYGISLTSKTKGIYMSKLRIIETDDVGNPLDENPYAEKTFFVTVN